MPENLQTVLYLIAAVLFISSLGGLAKQETARRGNLLGIIGISMAIVVTLLHDSALAYGVILGAIALGAIVGARAATRVGMTSMPELVAMLHSFVGLAAVLIGFATYLNPGKVLLGTEYVVHEIEIFIAVAVGAITFTGSLIAWAKLSGRMSGKPLLLFGRHSLNAVMALSLLVAGALFVQAGPETGLYFLYFNTAIACVLGIHLVMAIGGADMPVVVSLLNSYSGWAAAAAGFMLSNDLLIVTGALVGSSGAILSYIMCRAMNRSIWNVVFGGFGAQEQKAAPIPGAIELPVQSFCAEEVLAKLKGARRVVIIPGYGMAVAKAQHVVSQLTRKLRDHGVEVVFGVHPVAGRMPGHMNVLLAEADIPYEAVLEMEEVNPHFKDTDVVLVIGANDIVNPDALTDSSSPIFGMPQLEVWNARQVVVLKRGMSSGYAGVENPLFFRENTAMFFGDAHASVDSVLQIF
ncbi:MAG: NAD(P)(+) transhydrogenase (Re/Si-specific) subunit beta [Bradymonadaceae bacterium]